MVKVDSSRLKWLQHPLADRHETCRILLVFDQLLLIHDCFSRRSTRDVSNPIGALLQAPLISFPVQKS